LLSRLQGYQPPYEDADVLVLTAASSKFVDVRFPLLENHDPEAPLSAYSSFWAFSGTATTTFPSSNDGFEMPLAAHCAWQHEIDSHGPEITDEGDMFLLKNGDSMEIGVMENSETKQQTLYKEYWTGPKTQIGVDKEPKYPSVVAEMQQDNINSTRGRIIRVGNYCQGIMEIGQRGAQEVYVERWIRGSNEQWSRDPRSGISGTVVGQFGLAYPSLLCAWACATGRGVGDETVSNGVKWKITELMG
jgi:Protein HRI1